MPIELLIRKQKERVHQGKLKTRARIILKNLRCQDKDLSVLLTDDPEIHALNKRYRGVDRPTDVLAFPQKEDDPASPAFNMLGDVVISIDTASLQAEEQGHSLEKELFILLAHGIIHLLGYNHETSDADKKFTEKKIEELSDAVFDK